SGSPCAAAIVRAKCSLHSLAFQISARPGSARRHLFFVPRLRPARLPLWPGSHLPRQSRASCCCVADLRIVLPVRAEDLKFSSSPEPLAETRWIGANFVGQYTWLGWATGH